MNPSIKTIIRRIATVVLVTLACAAVIDWTFTASQNTRTSSKFVQPATAANNSVSNCFEMRIEIGALVFSLRI